MFQYGVRVAASRPRDALVAPLVRGTCTDAVVESGPATRRVLVYFDRDAPSFRAPVPPRFLEQEDSGLDCLAVGPDDDLVTLDVTAPRLGLSPGAVGDGPVFDGAVPAVECGGFRVFRWSDVVAWLRSAPGPAAREPAPAWPPVFAALNLALRLRRLIRADPGLVAAVRDLLGS
ncbi:hypothetical protein GCM10009558_088100 [Virgisporangium aurantiacum]